MSKKWLLGACGALLAGGLAASTANAGVLVDLRITAIDGVPLWTDPTDGSTATTLKELTLTHVGQTVQIDIFAKVTGANTNQRDDGLNALIGNIQSYMLAGTKRAGTGVFIPNGTDSFDNDNNLYVPVGVAPWSAPPANGISGPSPIAVKNLGPTQLHPDALDDGSPDLGMAPSDIAEGRVALTNAGTTVKKYAANNSGNWPYIKPDPDFMGGFQNNWVNAATAGAGWEDVIGSVIWRVDSLEAGLGQTLINWFPWEDTNGTLYYKALFWTPDSNNANYTTDGSSPGLTVGAPVILNVVPEPAGLSLLGLGALGLLARRRK